MSSVTLCALNRGAVRPLLSDMADIGMLAWNPQVFAEKTGVSLRTVRRWRHEGRAPRWAGLLIQLLFAGDLGAIDADWNGWHLQHGALAGPVDCWANWTFTPGEVLSLPLMRGQISAYQTKLRLSVQGDWVAERWTEPQEHALPRRG